MICPKHQFFRLYLRSTEENLLFVGKHRSGWYWKRLTRNIKKSSTSERRDWWLKQKFSSIRTRKYLKPELLVIWRKRNVNSQEKSNCTRRPKDEHSNGWVDKHWRRDRYEGGFQHPDLSLYISGHHRHHHRRCHHPHPDHNHPHVKVYTEPMEDGPINLANNKCEQHAPKVDSNSNEVGLTLCCNALVYCSSNVYGKMHEVKQSCFCRIRTELDRMIDGNDGLKKNKTLIPWTSSGINNRDGGRLDSNLGKGDPELDGLLSSSWADG